MELYEAVEFIKNYTGWDVVVCSLVGSRNYNLHSEDSDFDYTSFVIPPAGYAGREKRFATQGEIKINDLRKLPDFLWNSFPLDLEIAFSEKRYMTDEMDSLLYGNRERIAHMNLPKLYSQCIRKYDEHYKNLCKGTSHTQDLVAEYGYDTKQAMHAFRILFILQLFADTGSFERAIRYEGSERQFLMDVRNGKFSLEDVQERLARKFEYAEENYKEMYLGTEPDTEMYQMLCEGVERVTDRDLTL